MLKIPPSILSTLRTLTRSKIAIGIVAVLVVSVGGYFLFFHKNTTYQFVTVQRGSITESVSLTGNTTPAKSVSLSFGSSGIISYTYSSLGKPVYAGQVLALLNTRDLMAQLHQAQASVDSQQAKLEGLKSGSRPEDIAISQASLDKEKQDLVNMYADASDISVDSYAKANDAVRTQLSQFFSNSETQTPKLTYVVANFQVQTDSEAERVLATVALNTWKDKLASFNQSNASVETMLQNEISYLATIRQLLNNLSKTLTSAVVLSASTLDTYKTNVSTALTEVNTATKNLNDISQNIASQKLTVAQAQAQLDLKRSGSLPTDISAQQAQVAHAQASVDSVVAKIQNAKIIAPISGIVTQFDAKVGQLASLSTPLVSIMSSSRFEVSSSVSETNVGKISLKDKVLMTLDAFQNETFSGSVFYIAPSETNTQGVISYQVKISFDKPDSRLKSGLTANIDIQTNSKNEVLVLPQYAILQNDSGTFVESLINNTVKRKPVILGIQDQNGNVEIISGVNEGEQVLNIGLKAPK